jgi:predicted secreted protein
LKTLLLLALCAPAFALTLPAAAAPAALTASGHSTHSTLTLDADARSRVANDEMVVTLAIERDGADSARLSEQVLATLNDAVKAGKAVPGVAAQLGAVSTSPTWHEGKKIGWTMRGAVVLSSRDMAALAGLTGRLTEQLQLAGVQFRLSDARRRAEETRLLAEAAAAFRAKAQAATQAFGFRRYALGEMSLAHGGYAPEPRPMMSMAMKSERAALPAEGGDSEVAVTVSGKIRLLP